MIGGSLKRRSAWRAAYSAETSGPCVVVEGMATSSEDKWVQVSGQSDGVADADAAQWSRGM